MTRYWLTAVVVEVLALILWALSWQMGWAALMPIALFAGTVVPASAIGVDLGQRFLPTVVSKALAAALVIANVGVVIAIVLVLTWMEADLLRTPAAVERALGIPVLGAIPDSPTQKDAATASARPAQVGEPKTA